jgi:hypothetical protein
MERLGGSLGRWAAGLLLASSWTLAGSAVLADEGATVLEDRGPVQLRSYMVLTPPEAAGSGLAPEVKLRVEIDERGKVTEVEVLSIDPSSEFDDVFAESLRNNILDWRYAPKIEGGRAVPATLQWSVQLKPLGESSVTVPAPPSVAFEGDPEERRAKILALPLERRKKILEELVEKAQKHWQGEVHRVDSPRFIVLTDSDNPEAAEILANNLEATFSALDSLFEGQLVKQPEPYKMIAVIYRSRVSFQALLAETFRYEWSGGFYNPAGFLAFHLEVPGNDALQSMLLHEATHAYVDRYLTRRGVCLPRWLGEGFADYIGNSEVKKGKLVPGKTLKGKYVLFPVGGAGRVKTPSGWSFDRVKQALREGEGLSVAQVIEAEREVFYNDDWYDLYYPTSWLLVHYLRHGEEAWGDQEFSRFLIYTIEGYSSVEALRAVYGVTPEELEEPFGHYVKRF